jgi:hypothetical protein
MRVPLLSSALILGLMASTIAQESVTAGLGDGTRGCMRSQWSGEELERQ